MSKQTVLKIKDIIGNAMSNCQKNIKYEMLEYIMKTIIFEKMEMRQSFFQEILNVDK